MPRDEPVELGDELAVTALIEIGVDPRLDTDEMELVQPRSLDPGERLLELRERITPPERECLAQPLGRERCVPGCVRRVTLGTQPREPDDVDGRRLDLDRIPGRPGAKHPLRQDAP